MRSQLLRFISDAATQGWVRLWLSVSIARYIVGHAPLERWQTWAGFAASLLVVLLISAAYYWIGLKLRQH